MARKSTPIHDPELLSWRQQLNPLVGLNMSRLVMYFQNAQMGFLSDLMWLYSYTERRETTLRAVKHRRLAAIRKLDWDIKIKKGKEGAAANAQQEYLRSIYEGIDNLTKAFEFLALASFRGFSHLEKHYSNDGDVIHLEPVSQWYWARKLPLADFLYNPRCLQTATGIPIDPANFIIRECDDPIDEPCAIAFIRKNMSQKDWDGFIETFGIPSIFIELPLGVGSPGSAFGAKESEYQILAERIISDGRGVLPNGAKATTPLAGTNHSDPFEKHIRYLDETIVIAATSGLLTTLTKPTGEMASAGAKGGTGQQQGHQDAFDDLAESEAMDISETFQTQLDGPALNKEFPDQEVLVYFELAHDEVKDTTFVTDITQLATAGYRADEEYVSEKTGIPLTDVQKQQMEAQQQQQAQDPNATPDSQPQPVPEDNQPAYMRSGFPFLQNAAAKDFEPLSNALAKVLQSGDDELSLELERLNNRLPQLVKQMNVAPRMSNKIELMLVE